ncbi:ATP-binding cassette domain-containing protein, partial [Clostridium perfringens]|nr:ATP-binding cassette domain-containing protein [Clostridium perfringens]
LSGGEKQRTLIARALVQNTDFLVLDEPTNHLDIGYQIQLMDLVKSLNITTLAAIHDMNLAAMYCDYLIVMKDGKIKEVGTVEEIINSKMLKDVFGVNAYVGVNPINKKLQVSFMHTHEHIKGIGTDHVHEDGFTGVQTH